MIVDVLIQTILFSPLVYAVALSYRSLRCTDLTVEGSFVSGAAAMSQSNSLAGLCAGFLTGAVLGRVSPRDTLLSSIIMLFILYGFNLNLMGRPNVSVPAVSPILLCSAALLLLGAFHYLQRTTFMLRLRAMGDNPDLMQRLGYPVRRYRCLGLGISNMMAAVAGMLQASYHGYVDIMMGQGQALIAIGIVAASSYIWGQHIFITTLLYFFLLHILLGLGVDALYIKVIMGFLLLRLQR